MAEPRPKKPPSAPKRRPFPRHVSGAVMTSQAAQVQAPMPSKIEHDCDPSSSGSEGKGDKVTRTSSVAQETPRTTYGISFCDAHRRNTEGTFNQEGGRRSKLSSVAGARGLEGILDMEHADEGVLAPTLADIPGQATARGGIAILDEVGRPSGTFSGQASVAQRVPSRVMQMQAQDMDEGSGGFEGGPATFPNNLKADPEDIVLQDVLVDVLATVMTPRSMKATTRRANGAAGSSMDMIAVDNGEEVDAENVELLDAMLDIQLTDDMLLRQEAASEPRGPARALPATNSQWASFNPDAPATEAAPLPALDPILAPPVVAQEMLDSDCALSDEDEDEDEMMDRISSLLRAGHAGGLPASSSTDAFEDWCFEFNSARSVEPREAHRAPIHRWPSARASQAKIDQLIAAQAAAAAQTAQARAAVAALPGPQTDSPEPYGTSNLTLGCARQKFGNLPFGHRNRERGHQRGRHGDRHLPRTEFQHSSVTPTTVSTFSAISSSMGWTVRSQSPGDHMNEALEIGSVATMPVLRSGPIVSRTSTAGGDAALAAAVDAAVFQSSAADAAMQAVVTEENAASSSTRTFSPSAPANKTPAYGVATAALTDGTGTLSPLIQSATVNGQVLNGDVSRSLRRANHCTRTTGASSSASC